VRAETCGVVSPFDWRSTLWNCDASFPYASRLAPRETKPAKAIRQRRSGCSGSRPVTSLPGPVIDIAQRGWRRSLSEQRRRQPHNRVESPAGEPAIAGRNEVSHERITRPCKTVPGLRCRACVRADGRLFDRLSMLPLQDRDRETDSSRPRAAASDEPAGDRAFSRIDNSARRLLGLSAAKRCKRVV
jgi:hypothetical protein